MYQVYFFETIVIKVSKYFETYLWFLFMKNMECVTAIKCVFR